LKVFNHGDVRLFKIADAQLKYFELFLHVSYYCRFFEEGVVDTIGATGKDGFEESEDTVPVISSVY
jgi:hypothetical protein